MQLVKLGNESVGKTALIRTFRKSRRVNAVVEPLGYKYYGIFLKMNSEIKSLELTSHLMAKK